MASLVHLAFLGFGAERDLSYCFVHDIAIFDFASVSAGFNADAELFQCGLGPRISLHADREHQLLAIGFRAVNQLGKKEAAELSNSRSTSSYWR